MLKKTILLILGIHLFQISHSQVNYQPGVVVKNDGDTLRGYIDYRNWATNPDEINFKTNMADPPLSFKPNDLLEFRVMDEIYVSGIVQTEISQVKTDKLDHDPQFKIKVDTTFLQTLMKGDKSLYYYKNVNQKENFYIKKGMDFELLRYKRYLKIQNGKLVVGEDKRYLGQLTLYLKDCSTITKKLKNTAYKRNNLMDLFNSYFTCLPSDPTFKKGKEKICMEAGALTGITLTELSFNTSSREFYYLLNAQYDVSANFTSGVYFDFVMPRNQNKWSINNEVLFTSYSVNGMYEYVENSNKSTTTSTEIGYSYLKMNNLLRYRCPIKNMILFVNAGFSNGLAIHEKNYQKRELKLYDTKILIEEKAIYNTRRHEQGYVIGTGVKYKAFSLEMRYEKGNGISENINLGSSTKRYFLMLGYQFK